MSETVTLPQVAAMASRLSPAERKQLAERLLQELADPPTPTEALPRRSWRELRGLLPPGLYGLDAQSWVSEERHASDERREPRHKDTP